jgi:hypothetical protein
MRATAMGVAPICLISVCLKGGGHRIDAVPTTTDDQAKRLVIDHFRDRERESP